MGSTRDASRANRRERQHVIKLDHRKTSPGSPLGGFGHSAAQRAFTARLLIRPLGQLAFIIFGAIVVILCINLVVFGWLSAPAT